MAPTAAPPAMSRTSPTTLATPPTSVRPAVSAASSAPTSKSSCWTLIIGLSAAGHRREQRHLVAGLHGMIERGVLLIDGDPDDGAVGEGSRVLRTARGQPVEQGADGRHFGRRRHRLLADPDLALQPGEIKYLHECTKPIDRHRIA